MMHYKWNSPRRSVHVGSERLVYECIIAISESGYVSGCLMLHPVVAETLENIKSQINAEYGFHEGIPRINYGPCGVFAQVFFQQWNALFQEKVHICFVLTRSRDECDHVCICLPSGELYDGGIGVHTRDLYIPQFVLEDMLQYDEPLLEKWSYGLDRTYPRFCPNFDRKFVERIIKSNLENLFEKTLSPIV
jgi:hypothetical protein